MAWMAAVHCAIPLCFMPPVLNADSEKWAGHCIYFSISLEKTSLA
jgi:hypothetical protein